MKKENLIEGQTFARKCDATGEGFNEGYCFGDGTHYFKYEKDAKVQAKKDGYKNLQASHDDENHYWSTWEDETDHQYIVQNGVLVDMDDLDDRQIIELKDKYLEATKSPVLDAMQEAESFISGFEECDNKEEQKTVDRILGKLRTAIERAEDLIEALENYEGTDFVVTDELIEFIKEKGGN